MGKNDARDNGAKGDLIDLQGWEIRRVKNGLDEAQVISVINELIGQRDTLIERMEHLSSLTKLAEKTLAEADKLAEEIKTEAIDRAKAEAEEQAQQLKNENKRVQLELRNAIDGLCRQLVSEPESFKQRVMDLWAEFEHRLTQLVEHTSPTTSEAHEIDTDSLEPLKTVDQTSTSEPK